MSWAAGYSVQWKIGPLSEASIGNVGLNPTTVGWSDHVVTPAGGLLVMMGEDAIDRFVLEKLEDRLDAPFVEAALRSILNPSRALANVAALRAPWHRPGRALRKGPQDGRQR